MRKFLLLLPMIFLVFVAKAEYTIVNTVEQSFYTSYIVNYTSVGPDGETPATVSGAITVPNSLASTILSIFFGVPMEPLTDIWVLDSHHTIADNKNAPSVIGSSVAGSMIISALTVVIAPDYYGFGVTKDEVHPYLSQKQNARNSLDLLKVAMEFLPEKQHIEPFMLCNLGYSQGAGVAMAAHYLLENDEAYTDIVPQFKGGLHTWCGDGPYDPVTTGKDIYSKPDHVIFPALLPMLVNGFLTSAPAELSEGLSFKDFFTEALLTPTTIQNPVTGEPMDFPGIEKLIAAKELNNDEVNAVMRAVASGKSGLADFFTAEMCDMESALYQKFNRWLVSNSVCTDWKPENEMFLYHLVEDDIVTFANTELAAENLAIPADHYFAQHESEFKFKEGEEKHSQYAPQFFKSFGLQVLQVYRQATGIDAVHSATVADAPCYDMQGNKVGADYHGIVISNGHKYIK